MRLPTKVIAIICCGLLSTAARAQTGSVSQPYVLNPSPTTVAWGYYWSEAKPALHVRSGDYVRVHTLITSDPRRLEAAGLPPDQVEKELRDVQSVTDKGPGGYNAIGQNGFLSDEIFDRKMRLISLDAKKMTGHFADGIDIPLHPFFGSAGVAPPKEAGRWNSAPPWVHAGNLDNKEPVEGSSLFIPVHVEGALFEIGDGHAAQGNGEVDITAETVTHIITMGCDRDLNAATHVAVREMIGYLMSERKMSQADAYALCSVSVDVNITQLVDGNVGVHAMLPKAIFTKK